MHIDNERDRNIRVKVLRHVLLPASFQAIVLGAKETSVLNRSCS